MRFGRHYDIMYVNLSILACKGIYYSINSTAADEGVIKVKGRKSADGFLLRHRQ
jgi:hypothetical protein